MTGCSSWLIIKTCAVNQKHKTFDGLHFNFELTMRPEA